LPPLRVLPGVTLSRTPARVRSVNRRCAAKLPSRENAR